MKPPNSPLFDAWVGLILPRNQLWRTLAGILIVLACWFLIAVLIGAVSALVVLGRSGLQPEITNAFTQELASGATPRAVIIALLTFAGTWVGAMVAIMLLHRRPVRDLFAAPGHAVFGGFWRGAAVALGFAGIPTLIVIAVEGLPPRGDIAFGDWALLLLAVVPLVFLQAGGEEVVFRGYILQALVARFRNPVIWGGLPAIAFGVLHFWNSPDPAVGAVYSMATAVFGIAAAIMVWQWGGLGPALGFHVANNLIGIAFFGTAGLLDGVALYVADGDNMGLSLLVDAAILLGLVGFLLSRWSPFRRRGLLPEDSFD